MAQNANGEKEMIYYPVPLPTAQARLEMQTPTPTETIPAVLSYIIRVRDKDECGAPLDLLYFYIGRDRSVPLVSFTITYRFSTLPIMLDDPEKPFYTYTYTDDDINDDNAYIVCKFTLPSDRLSEFPGCGAYVNEVTFADGSTRTWCAQDFTYSDADMEKMSDSMSAYYAHGTHAPIAQTKDTTSAYGTQSDEDETYDALLAAQRDQNKRHQKRFRRVRIIGYIMLLCSIGVLISLGSRYLAYQNAMLGAQVYLDAREYKQAETYAEEAVGDNLFYLTHKQEMTKTVMGLLTAARYNEAYKVATLTPNATLLQSVCRTAADAALAEGDYKTAYLYACGAPDPFDEEIIAAASAVVLDPYAQTLDENAYLVAQKTTDEDARNDLLQNLVRYACEENHYHTAMRAALAITDADICAATVADIFGVATHHYIKREEYRMAADFITQYAEGNDVDPDVKEALIAFFSESTDSDSAFFLSKQFGIDASHINIAAEDSAVRADLAGIYPLLTETQKRAYHARSVSAGGVLFTVDDDGRVTLGTDPTGGKPSEGDASFAKAQARLDALLANKNVVSVASSSLTTAFLLRNGTVTMISNRIIGGTGTVQTPAETRLISDAEKLKNVIAVAEGESHFVYLKADGTVVCSGDNTYGQCKTDSWRDIAAIAAGKHFTIGLRTDGTVVACGENGVGQCDTANFANVVAVAACDRTTVVLFADGTASVAGEVAMGIADIKNLSGIRRIRAGGSAVIAETADGTFHICGSCAASGNYGSTASWHNVLDYDVGNVRAAAIEENGTRRTTGTNRA